MGDFRKSGGKRFDGGRGGGFGRNRDRGPVTMHQAICAQCGKPCEVPFRPTEGKPVYCNICFRDKKETGYNKDSYKTPARTDFGSNINKGNNDELKKQFDILNTKLDRIIKSLTPVVPVKEDKKSDIINNNKTMAKGNNSRRKETKKPKKDKKK